MKVGLNLPDNHHGIHLATPIKGHEELVWMKPRVGEKYRVREHTCECKSRGVVYELCISGGLMFIRKIYRDFHSQTVTESERWRTARAKEMWVRLITGQVR